MRISDWSSDVCSSDLHRHRGQQDHAAKPGVSEALYPESNADQEGDRKNDRASRAGADGDSRLARRVGRGGEQYLEGEERHGEGENGDDRRSEEHTSELKSLMRISYAVFCLTKKKD